VIIIQRWSSCHWGRIRRITTQRRKCRLAPPII
jgi:hypothetical protein